MTISLPLVVVLALLAWMAIKFFAVRLWIVAVLVLLGFYLAHSFLAPAIDSTTRTGVHIVNDH
ncbi:hypothetical protein GXW83_33085 [Streptacidiphilus sp. PB12-B1b]|uniref:hypothetical protein n=1 Tax=Streptacidiphilus sp. PB12-B1b TaxID=2705012 RepID=UPI0015F81471|nr:hypothetical protein [Streptacidiphilus sp. PB12-B1b]QMU79818.1 hypothetical protein GXW83_33085 [Streptacidiphilus sp. PB12-B1b]